MKPPQQPESVTAVRLVNTSGTAWHKVIKIHSQGPEIFDSERGIRWIRWERIAEVKRDKAPDMR